MTVRFLVGPAGSGKTFRCLSEVAQRLKTAPDGAPLLFLAPKQATFQLERQLLSDPELTGYTRLQILSFDRLAEFVLGKLQFQIPKLLDEEGRVMVLRALLARHQPQLKLFHSSAALPGFAVQLSLLLRHFQRHQLSPTKLVSLSERFSGAVLGFKLKDAAFMLDQYSRWLEENHLEDRDRLLDYASERLDSLEAHSFPVEEIWLDGFAEMTPQELHLLGALLRHCHRSTLAFCTVPEAQRDWLSPWAVVGKTFDRCWERFGKTGRLEQLKVSENSRFEAPALKHLESHWSFPKAFEDHDSSISLTACRTPEAEAHLAARIIHQHVKAGGRYREVAILLREFSGYDQVLRRVLPRFEIPYFLDRRESISHHSLAELTRYALRTVAFGWRAEDWFGVLKSGLVPLSEEAADWLETEALRHGWEGKAWKAPLSGPSSPRNLEALEEIRSRVVPDFIRLENRLKGEPNGKVLAAAIREMWRELKVEKTFEQWEQQKREETLPHFSVLEQMLEWLEDLEMAFEQDGRSVAEWLPILESGLSGLSVGAIPPSLDQVLIGAVDRSRNPDLRLTIVMGLTEGKFPAAPSSLPLLDERDRNRLESENVFLGQSYRDQIGHERYLGYIALTRSRERLVLTWPNRNAKGDLLKPSPFVKQVLKLFPDKKPEFFSGRISTSEVCHFNEAIPVLVREAVPLPDSMKQKSSLAFLSERRGHELESFIAPEIASALYGAKLETSVHGMEEFGSCPFRFFVHRGLRAQERLLFELNSREKGTFVHDLLNAFHERTVSEERKWRDYSAEEAAQIIRQLGEEFLPAWKEGLLVRSPAAAFEGGLMIKNTEKFIGTLVEWAKECGFDPHRVELTFGLEEEGAPAWVLELEKKNQLLLRGRIDRVDLCQGPDGKWYGLVMDYKSSKRRVDDEGVFNGLELQLLAYLCVLRDLHPQLLDIEPNTFIPGGVFYIGLRCSPESSPTRTTSGGKSPHVHQGRFVKDLQPYLCTGAETTGQFVLKGKQGISAQELNTRLDHAQSTIREFGSRILCGDIQVAPYRKGQSTACDYCLYDSVCRFDPWIHPFRKLRPLPPP